MLLNHGLAGDRIVIAYPGVDPERVRPRGGDVRRRMGVSGSPVLLSVGRLAPHKGFASVIAALPRIAHRWPEVVYLVVGRGEEEARLREMAARLKVEVRIRWLGVVGDEELRDAYAAADLFVQPNGEARGLREGYGMVYIEAGAAGLPVIGGRSGGVVEAVRHGVTGFLVTPFDEDELVEAVERLLEDGELRRRMGDAGRALAQERTWDRTLLPVLRIDRLLSSAGVEVSD
jgi:phosphatidylinositol alpha-1,6-mannosyltransferase